jgi:hypothetical protein
MYSYARLLDLRSRKVCKEAACGIDDLLVVTNTKFTSSAIRYANCVGVKLLSWGYPREDPLQKRIEGAGLYPITALTTLSVGHKRTLLENDVILCREIAQNPDVLAKYGIQKKKAAAVFEEIKALCKAKK